MGEIGFGVSWKLLNSFGLCFDHHSVVNMRKTLQIFSTLTHDQVQVPNVISGCIHGQPHLVSASRKRLIS